MSIYYLLRCVVHREREFYARGNSGEPVRVMIQIQGKVGCVCLYFERNTGGSSSCFFQVVMSYWYDLI